MEKAYKVSAESSFLSLEKTSLKETIQDFEQVTKKLEDFLRTLERKFHEIIWYIGTDIIEDKLVERFMFKKSGFMEIAFGTSLKINAFFSSQKKAQKFSEALGKAFAKYGKRANIKVYM